MASAVLQEIAINLGNDTGLEAFDAGSVADSWRQQPGAPCFALILSTLELAFWILVSETDCPSVGVTAVHGRLGDGATNPDEGWSVCLDRAITCI